MTREWVDSFENGGKDEKILLLLGEKVEGGRNGGVCGAVGGCMGDEMCGRVVAEKENSVIRSWLAPLLSSL